MPIRLATSADAPAISALIAASAHHFLLDGSGRGAERFLQSITPQALAGYLCDPRFHYLVATADADDASGEIVGAIALRDGRHLFHLFVAARHQRQGLARALWTEARKFAAPDTAVFTVNSSPNAVAVYARWGFVPTGAQTEMNGIAFVPMQTALMKPHPG